MTYNCPINLATVQLQYWPSTASLSAQWNFIMRPQLYMTVTLISRTLHGELKARELCYDYVAHGLMVRIQYYDNDYLMTTSLPLLMPSMHTCVLMPCLKIAHIHQPAVF